jgi:hypothetical protein
MANEKTWNIETPITTTNECLSMIQWMKLAIKYPNKIPRNELAVRNEIHTFLSVMRYEMNDFWKEYKILCD